MKIGFSYASIASIIGYRSNFTDKARETPLTEKISSVKNAGNICLSKSTGRKMLSELQLAEHDMNKRITRKAADSIKNYLHSTHNPANEKRVRFDV